MKSLQDQLRKSGLVDEQKARQVATEKRKQTKAERRQKGKSGKPSAMEPTANAMRDRNAARDRALNQKKEAIQERKAIAAQIRQLIIVNEVATDGDDVAWNFVHGGKIKTIAITERLRAQLIAGHLAIAALESRPNAPYALVPDAVARKIAERNPDAVVRSESSEARSEQAEDDPYAGFEVPDDLMW